APKAWAGTRRERRSPAQIARHVNRNDRVAIVASSLDALLCLAQRAQRDFPPSFELAGDEPVIWIGSIVLPACEVRLVAKALELAVLSGLDFRPLRTPRLHRLLVEIQLCRCQRFEERFDDDAIDRVRGQVLADRQSALLTMVIAEVTR